MDVLCVGHASYDHVFVVPHHPGPDEKLVASVRIGCGGGPAANAAVTAARLGCRTGFMGYLGHDLHGQLHFDELVREGVDVRHVIRAEWPTPVSVVLVKPDGSRALVNHRARTEFLKPAPLEGGKPGARVLLFDGHEPLLAESLLDQAVPRVLDAGSLHAGTEALMFRVDHLVCSETFAAQWLGGDDPRRALAALAEQSPAVVITQGARGLIWRRGSETGQLPAFPVAPVDTTGAGDAFHGAYAAGLAMGMAWSELLRFASAAGAACCAVLGARPGLPDRASLDRWLAA